MQPDLATLIDSVPDRRAVYDADLAAARDADLAREALDLEPFERTAEDRALDGVAHHVFNVLRGTEDTVADYTFADVRAIVAESL